MKQIQLHTQSGDIECTDWRSSDMRRSFDVNYAETSFWCELDRFPCKICGECLSLDVDQTRERDRQTCFCYYVAFVAWIHYEVKRRGKEQGIAMASDHPRRGWNSDEKDVLSLRESTQE
ncbi:hypothetical protein CEXT_323051 [Caerostris extrusa]|uniref:Uncharacterized protein n=1 Tax=Caerostris extrusa TaxID=172846 RepID=A0AAV4N5A9_CAEEX|nr:hypothetical protein CEXT_323051 [Caerostris extrusa]